MTKVFAHRGYSGHYPENTLLAFSKAIEVNSDGIELDVQLTKDGELVIVHDEELGRTIKGEGLVKDYILKELQNMQIIHNFGEDIKEQRIPTLREYFELVKDANITTNIELKTSVYEYEGIEKKTIDLVKEFGLEDKVWYSSFNHYTLLRVKEIAPSANCGILICDWIVNVGQYAKNIGMQSVNSANEFLKKDIVTGIHENGIIAQAYTPNSEEMLTWLINNGVDIVITNYPERAQKLINK